ncbi:EBP-domain-containing protein [Violaceomyces palustris]|uniref:EBP-domain-containing protein n=1 Tax=Violaceomyces palustris TaxID=1673888 RepID=A0ACD0P8I0_9BASI|nr:EBP-domain-containing protein [Violaceomyces palustris]
MEQLLTKQSLSSLGFVASLVGGASVLANLYLPSNASAKTKTIFVWLAFDALTHLSLEASFLYLSVLGRSVNTSTGFFAETWKEYAKADARWGFSDPNVVSIEYLTVLGAGPMAAYICYQMITNDPSYHYWIIVLSTAELYGGFMTFSPEWLTGSQYLDTSNWLFTWVYLAFMNLLWVFIPLWLMLDSYQVIARTLRATGDKPKMKVDKRYQGSTKSLGLTFYLVALIALFVSLMPTVKASEVQIRRPVGKVAPTSLPSLGLPTSFKDVITPVALVVFLVSLSLFVGSVQFLDSWTRKTKRTNRLRRRKILESLGIDEKKQVAEGGERKIVLGFFHPYCNAGGGGERVLFEAIAHHQRTDSRVVCIVYTGDVHKNGGGATKEEIIEKCKARFGIGISPATVHFLPLKRRALVDDGYWKRFTLLGQSFGSMVMAAEAMGEMIPDVFIDTMGYAFAFPVVRHFAPNIPIGAYIHYPTISTDMLRRVEKRESGHTNDSKVAKSAFRSKAKLFYYRIFAWVYSWALLRADKLTANGSWTKNHIDTLILPPKPKGRVTSQRKECKIIFPPCDTSSFNTFPLSGRGKTLVSLAQFRPEKEHSQQLKLLRRLFDLRPDLHELGVHLVMMGSCRNKGDEDRIESLKALAKDLEVQDRVRFVVNAPFPEVLKQLSEASVGISTMVDEHFGINVVEFMAAGLITLSHASAGPLLDIAVPVDEKPTGEWKAGFHATDTDSFARQAIKILELDPAEEIEIRERARRRAVQVFGAESFCERWQKDLWEPLLARNAAKGRNVSEGEEDDRSKKEK